MYVLPTMFMVFAFTVSASAITPEPEAEVRSSRQLQARSRTLYFEPPESLLFHRPCVERELGLSREQRAVYRVIYDTWLTEVKRQLQRRHPHHSILDGAALWPATAAAFAKLRHTLSRPQQIRFDQLVLQCQGLVAIQDREIQVKLGLTTYQARQIHLIISASLKQMSGMEQSTLSLNSFRRCEALRAQTAEKLRDVLNTTQQARWREMIGKPFEAISDRKLRLMPLRKRTVRDEE